MKNIVVGIFSMMACLWAHAGDLPDATLTPGALNPEVSQANIHQTVCVKGWTKSIRPPANYTNRLKRQQIRQYGYADSNPRDYEEDHLVPLSVGGHPTDPRNLWPQPRKSQWNGTERTSWNSPSIAAYAAARSLSRRRARPSRRTGSPHMAATAVCCGAIPMARRNEGMKGERDGRPRTSLRSATLAHYLMPIRRQYGGADDPDRGFCCKR